MAERGRAGSWEQLVLLGEDREIDLRATRAALPANDQQAARLMADLIWTDQLHYVPGDKKWYVCADDHSYHPEDDSSVLGRRVERLAIMLGRALEACHQRLTTQLTQAHKGKTQDQIDLIVAKHWKDGWGPVAGYAAGLRKAKGLRDIKTWLVDICGTRPEVMVDHFPQLLNMGNCTAVLDPSGPPWVPHDPARLHTYRVEAGLAAMDGDPLALCPRYAAMLWHAAGEDAEVFWYLVKVLGYAALGANPLHLVFFLSGPPRSGKTKLLEVLSTVLGPTLSYEAKPDLLGSSPHSRDETTMRGKRVITISETNERMHINEAQLKRLTGAAHISVSMLWDKTMTRVPVTWLFIIDNNQMPKIDYMDAGLAARSLVLPMGDTIPVEDRNPFLAEQIVEAERDGIATMLVWACREAMREGGKALMMPPAAVVRATETYRAEQDTIGLWLAERVRYTLNGHSRAQAGSDVYDNYLDWCHAKDEQAAGRNTFYADLANRQGISKTGDAHHVWFVGFELAIL